MRIMKKSTISFILSIMLIINSITPVFAISENSIDAVDKEYLNETLEIDNELCIETMPDENNYINEAVEIDSAQTSPDITTESGTKNFTNASELQKYLNSLDSLSANEVTINMLNYVADKPVIIDDSISAKLSKLTINDCINPTILSGVSSIFEIRSTTNVSLYLKYIKLSNISPNTSFIKNTADSTLTLRVLECISLTNSRDFSFVENNGRLNSFLSTINYIGCERVSFVTNKKTATITTTSANNILTSNATQCSYVAYTADNIPTLKFSSSTARLLIENPGVNFVSQKIVANNTYIAGAFHWNNSGAEPTNSLFIKSIGKSDALLDLPKSENHLVMTSDMTSFSAPDLLGSYSSYYLGKDSDSVNIKWSADSKLITIDENTGTTTRVSPNSRGIVKVSATITPKADGYLDSRYRYKSFTITNLIELYDKTTIASKDIRTSILSSTTELDGYKKAGNRIDFSWDLLNDGNVGASASISQNTYKISGVSLSGEIASYFDAALYKNDDLNYAECFLLIPKEDENGALLFDSENKKEFSNTTVKFYLQSVSDEHPISFEKQIDMIKFIGKKPKLKFTGTWKLNSYYEPSIYQLNSYKYKGKPAIIDYDNLSNHVKFSPIKKGDALDITNLKIDSKDSNYNNFDTAFDNNTPMLLYKGDSDKLKCKLNLYMSFDGYFGAYNAPLSVAVSKIAPKLSAKNMKELILGEKGYNQKVYANAYGIINSIASISANSANYMLDTSEITNTFLKPGNLKFYTATIPVFINPSSNGSKIFKNESETIDLKITLDKVKAGNEDTFELSQKITNTAGNVALSAFPGTLDKNLTDYIYSKNPTITVEPSSKITVKFDVKNNDKFKQVTNISLLSSSNSKKLPTILGGNTVSGNMYENFSYLNSTVLGTQSGNTIQVSGAAKPGQIKILACFTMRDGDKKALPITIQVVEKTEFSITGKSNLTIDLNGYLGNNADMVVKGQKNYFKPGFKGAAYGETTLKDAKATLINIDKMPPLNHKGKITVSSRSIYCSDKNFLATVSTKTGCISIIPRREKIIDGTLLPNSTHDVVLQYRDACGKGAEQTIKVKLVKSKPVYKADQSIDLYNSAGYVEKVFDFNILSKSAKLKSKLLSYKLSNNDTYSLRQYKYIGKDNYSPNGCNSTTLTQPYFANTVTDFAIDSSFTDANNFVITRNANSGENKNKFTIALANGTTITPGQYKIPFKVRIDGYSDYVNTQLIVNVK